MRLGQTSAIYLIAKITGSVIGFFATIYFTRTLGEEIYGFYAITMALVSWLGIVKSIGFGKAMVKRMSEDEEPYAYLAAGTIIKAALTIIVVLGVLFFRNQVNAYIGQPVAEFVVLLLIVSIFSGIVSAALQGTHRVHVYAPLSTIKQAARTVAMITLVFVGWELTGMLFGYALGTVLISFIGLIYIRPSINIPDTEHFLSLVNFAKYSWLGNMRSKSIDDIDILVLGLFVPAGLTGIYAVAWTLSRFLDIFGSAIKDTLFPEMSKLSTEGDMKMINEHTINAVKYSGLFLIPGIVGAALLGDRLMLIYGPGFEAGTHILVILLFGLLIYTYAKQLLSMLDAIDRPDLAFRANGIFVISNLILNIVFVYSIGWTGAAIATALSTLTVLLCSLYYSRIFVSLRLPYNEISRQWVAAIVMGITVGVLRMIGEQHSVSDFNLLFVLLLVTFGAIIYFSILLMISSDFRTTVYKNIPTNIQLYIKSK